MSPRERGRRGSGRGRGGRAGHCPPPSGAVGEGWGGRGHPCPRRGTRWVLPGRGSGPDPVRSPALSDLVQDLPYPPRSHRPWARSWAAGQGRAVSEALKVPVGSETWPPDSQPQVFQNLDGVLFLH